ncbi:phage protein [Geomicrobium sp. JCM 19039]|nr:phage protein [Geomicrobium sp. JCM 19039]
MYSTPALQLTSCHYNSLILSYARHLYMRAILLSHSEVGRCGFLEFFREFCRTIYPSCRSVASRHRRRVFMDINNLIQRLEQQKGNVDLTFYLSRKRTNNKYYSFSPDVDPGLKEELLDLVISSLDHVKEYPQEEYNPVGVADQTLEKIDSNNINNYTEIVNSINQEIRDSSKISTDEIARLDFYLLRIRIAKQDGYEEIHILRRINKMSNLRKGLLGEFRGQDFIKLEPHHLIGIDSNVDVVIYNGEALVLSHISLERIFDLKDHFKDTAKKALNIVKETKGIENFDQFYEDCLSDGRVIRAFTKLMNEEEKVERCFQNFDNVRKVIKIFELPINLNGDKIVYENKDQLMEIARLIRDSYYQSYIGEEDRVDATH